MRALLVCPVRRRAGATQIQVPRDGVQMNFEVDEQLKGKASNANNLPSVDELRAVCLTWFQKNKPDMCKPRLVVDLAQKGWHVLFTPPYCPDLQPIELFWAAGKNHARAQHPGHTRDLDAVATDLRIGWYGDGGDKRAVKCDGLVRTAIAKANQRVAADEFLSGTVDGEDGLTVSDECELEIGVDSIGRATRTMSRRAAQGGAEDPAVNGDAIDDANAEDSDDEDGDDGDDDE